MPRVVDSTNSTDDRRTLADWVRDRATALSTQYERAAAGVSETVHCPTGLARLDAAGLLELGFITTVLAHAGDGKSAFALQMLEGCARAGYPAQGYFMEDPGDLTADRVIAGLTGYSAFALRRGKAEGAVSDRLASAVDDMEEWGSRIQMDEEQWETGELLARITSRFVPGTRLIAIDYAQAFDAEGDERSVERVISRLVWKLNLFAKEHKCSVLLLSQVNTKLANEGRQVFDWWKRKHPDESPNLSAIERLRPGPDDAQWATGAIKAKSRQIISLFRPGYHMRLLGENWQDNTMQVKIVKGNYGPGAELMSFNWDGPTCKITDRR